MNCIQLIGRLTADPELRYTPAGTPIGKFRLAVPGRGDDEVDFVDVVCFKRLAEVVAEHLGKGRQVGVTGRLSYSEWTAEDGSRRSRHEVIADNVTFLGSPTRDSQQDTPAEAAVA